jgi:Cu(I)/Ag(I) efflux system membrane fusion protein
MKNIKNIAIIIGVLLIGIFFGKLFFSNTKTAEIGNHEYETVTERWTCSMHPQIDLPEAGACPICGMDLIPKIQSDDDEHSENSFKLTKNAMALANIETTIIGEGDVSSSLTLSGKIQENESANATQTAHFNGRIEKLYANFTGEKVNRGQLLALVYSPELVTAQKELLEALKVKNTQPTLYNAVRNKLKLWKLSEKQISSIETTGKVRTNFPIYADVSGIISEKMVNVGDHVMEGQALYSISNLTTLWAAFDVYERDIKNFTLGQQIEISPNAFPNKIIKAKISFIDPILNTSTRTITVRANLQNKNNLLKPGMLLTSNVKMDKNSNKKTVLMLPKSAVLWTGKRSVVYVKILKNESVFEMREVMLGSETSNEYEILSGLERGEEVVANGAFTVDAAAQLQGKKSMMNKAGGRTMTGHEGHLGMETATGNSNETQGGNMIMIDKSKINKKFKQQLGNVVTQYIQLKNALVDDNANLAQKTAKNVKKSLDDVDMLLLKGDAHNLWMKSLKPLKEAVTKIQNSQEIGIQREAFLVLGKNLSEAIKTLGVETENKQPLYLEFCPMADSNKGGFWLSYEEEIKNPFFGKAMLTCGEVKATY